ncbi:MAG: DNA polymerase III subunit delta [Candidatus Moraniibacteriota bacterium]
MLFFLYGEDSFRSLEKVLEIKKKFQLNDKSGAGLSSFDALDEKNISPKIERALKNTGLFSSKKLLILKNSISQLPSEEQAKILAFLKKNITQLKDDLDSVIIFWEKENPRKNNALFKFFLAEARKQSFEKLVGSKLDEWVLRKIKTSGGAGISRPALEKLIIYTDGNTASISQEIEKLISYEDGEIIDEKAVDLLLESQSGSDIFKTIEALASNNKKLAVKLLRAHLDRGDDLFYLFSMFVYQFRNLLRIASLQENGIFNEFEIAKLAKLHPFVVKKSASQARNFGEKKLIAIHKKLGILDTKIKTGKIDIKLALDKFIVEL